MPTANLITRLTTKRVLSLVDLRERWQQYMQGVQTILTRLGYGASGAFSPIDFDIGTADKFSVIGPGWAGVTGDGYVVLAENAQPWLLAVPFENLGATDYEVGIPQSWVPGAVARNPRTGVPEYTADVEALGKDGYPSAVVDNGDGTITLTITNVCDPGNPGHTYAGRTCRVWLVTPQSGVAATAFEQRTVVLSGGVNKITTAGSLGQTTISTTTTDYRVLMYGPMVRKGAGSISALTAPIFVGTVTGGGAGLVPAAKSTTGQRVFGSMGAMLADVLEWANGRLKVRVQADALDSATPQLSVKDTTGARVWQVDELGNQQVGKATAATSPVHKLTTSLGELKQYITGAAGRGVLELTSAAGELYLKTASLKVLIDQQLEAVGALALKDFRTPTQILFSAADATALHVLLPQNLLGAINVVAEHVYDLTYSGRARNGEGVVLSGAVATQTGALQITVGSAMYRCSGRTQIATSTAVAITDNATRYLYWKSSDQTYALATTINVGAANVLLGKVVAAAGAITSYTDLRTICASMVDRTDVIVHPTAGVGHFTSLADAVKAVGEWTAPTAGTSARAYRILVVGQLDSLAETITIPCDGLEIRGVSRTTYTSVTWEGDRALFDINGKSDVTIRDLQLVYSSGAAAGTTQNRFALTSSAGNCNRLHVEGVRLTTLNAGNRAHGFGYFPYSTAQHVIRNCMAVDLEDMGLFYVDDERSMIEHCRFSRTGSAGSSPAQHVSGIELESADATAVRTCTTSGFYRGVLTATTGGTCTHCWVDQHYSVGEDKGIDFTDGTDHSRITNCVVEGAGNATLAVGITVDGDYNVVHGCDTKVVAALTQYGIRLDTNADYCMVSSCQTNGFTLSIFDGANNTSTGNRDDV